MTAWNSSLPTPSKPLSEATLAQLFLPFRRGATRSGGVGLGLYIVHEIVVAHGGSVKAESRDGRMQFVVRLPRVIIDDPLERGQ